MRLTLKLFPGRYADLYDAHGPILVAGRTITGSYEEWAHVAAVLDSVGSDGVAYGRVRAVRGRVGWIFDDPSAPEAPVNLRASLTKTGHKEYFFLSDEDAPVVASEIRRVLT